MLSSVPSRGATPKSDATSLSAASTDIHGGTPCAAQPPDEPLAAKTAEPAMSEAGPASAPQEGQPRSSLTPQASQKAAPSSAGA